MFKFAFGFLTLLFTSTVFTLGSHAQPPAQAGERIRVWIQYAPSHGNDLAKELKANNAKVHYRFDDLNAFAATIPTQAMQGLMNNPHVVLVEEDPERKPFSQTTPWGIIDVQAPSVWSSQTTGDGVLVCVIDSGLSAQHEDHNNSAITNLRSVTGHSKFPAEDWDVDGCGHGTHVAGTIAALTNDAGVIGVAPTDPAQGIAGVSLHIEKVFDSACGNAYSSDIVNAAKLCQQKGAKVINMSLGSGRSSKSEQKAFDQLYNQGVLSVAAAGNDGNNTFSYPASYSSVVSVAAVDSTNTIASFSNQNSQVELAAPGVDVNSTVPFLNTLTAGGTTYSGAHIENSAWGSASGGVVDGGLCDATGSWGGKIVLCERGLISFYDKVMNVQTSGGSAAMIYNNEPGGFAGTLGTGNNSTIPAISLSQEDGQTLVSNLPPTGSLVSSNEESGYESWAGTSMATPHVAGVAALIWSANTSWSNIQVRTALQNSASDLGASGRDNAYGYGLVQAQTALQNELGGAPSGKPTADFSSSCTDLNCAFVNLSGAGTYTWNFGDGSSAQGAAPSHAYAAAGSYPVILTVTVNGVSASTIHQVNVIGPTSVPPGGDTAPPVISAIQAGPQKGTAFKITWITNEPATSVVTFTNLSNATYADETLVMDHSMSFRGTKGFTYEFTVSSIDAAGNIAISGPHYYTP